MKQQMIRKHLNFHELSILFLWTGMWNIRGKNLSNKALEQNENIFPDGLAVVDVNCLSSLIA